MFWAMVPSALFDRLVCDWNWNSTCLFIFMLISVSTTLYVGVEPSIVSRTNGLVPVFQFHSPNSSAKYKANRLLA